MDHKLDPEAVARELAMELRARIKRGLKLEPTLSQAIREARAQAFEEAADKLEEANGALVHGFPAWLQMKADEARRGK